MLVVAAVMTGLEAADAVEAAREAAGWAAMALLQGRAGLVSAFLTEEAEADWEVAAAEKGSEAAAEVAAEKDSVAGAEVAAEKDSVAAGTALLA